MDGASSSRDLWTAGRGRPPGADWNRFTRTHMTDVYIWFPAIVPHCSVCPCAAHCACAHVLPAVDLTGMATRRHKRENKGKWKDERLRSHPRTHPPSHPPTQ